MGRAEYGREWALTWANLCKMSEIKIDICGQSSTRNCNQELIVDPGFQPGVHQRDDSIQSGGNVASWKT